MPCQESFFDAMSGVKKLVQFIPAINRHMHTTATVTGGCTQPNICFQQKRLFVDYLIIIIIIINKLIVIE